MPCSRSFHLSAPVELSLKSPSDGNPVAVVLLLLLQHSASQRNVLANPFVHHFVVVVIVT